MRLFLASHSLASLPGFLGPALEPGARGEALIATGGAARRRVRA